jgi:uncharacterized membrane protein YkoI
MEDINMFKKRVYWVIGLVALLALSGAAVSLTSGITSADSPTPTPAVVNSDQQVEVDDAAEPSNGADTDAIEEQTGNQDEAQDANGQDTADSSEQDAKDANDGTDASEQKAPAGQIDDGADLLPQASITLDQAIAAAQGAANGMVGEVDLEKYDGKLVFNVDIGAKDVKIDAADGSVIAVDSDD